MKKIVKRAVLLLLVLPMLPTAAYAAGRIETDRDVTLFVSYKDEDTPLVDAEFRVYLVASVNEFGELTVADTFEQFNIDLQGGNDRRRLGSDAVYLHDRRKETDHSPLHADGRIKMQTPTGHYGLSASFRVGGSLSSCRYSSGVLMLRSCQWFGGRRMVTQHRESRRMMRSSPRCSCASISGRISRR